MKEWKCKSQTKYWYYYKRIFGIPDLLKKVRGAHRVLRNTLRTFGWIHSFNICEIIQTSWMTSADPQGALILNIKASKYCWLTSGPAQRQRWSGVQKGQRMFHAASFRAWALGNRALTGSGSFKAQIRVKDLKAPPRLSVVLFTPPFLQAACTELQVRPASCIPHGCPRRTTVIISPTISAQPAPRRHGAGRGHTSVAPLRGLAIDKDIPHMWSPRLAPDHATGYTALLGNSLCFCPLSFLISC